MRRERLHGPRKRLHGPRKRLHGPRKRLRVPPHSKRKTRASGICSRIRPREMENRRRTVPRIRASSQSMTTPQHPKEPDSNCQREAIAQIEPKSLVTFTPSQAVLAKSAGSYHWTPEGRKLFDFTSGVLVANLGHNPSRWMNRFSEYMGWTGTPWKDGERFFDAVTLTAYNGITPVEKLASERLV